MWANANIRVLAEVSFVKGQVPRPESADELCTAAHDLKVEARNIYFGARTIGAEVKRRLNSLRTRDAQEVHFKPRRKKSLSGHRRC